MRASISKLYFFIKNLYLDCIKSKLEFYTIQPLYYNLYCYLNLWIYINLQNLKIICIVFSDDIKNLFLTVFKRFESMLYFLVDKTPKLFY